MAGYAPLDEMESHGVGVFFCHPCKAEYLYFQSGDLASSSLYTEINGRMYRWTMAYGGCGMLWFVKEPGIPGKKKNEGLEAVKSFDPDKGDIVPQLTPSNINEKLRTYLVFL
jgi:hypothetical protein